MKLLSTLVITLLRSAEKLTHNLTVYAAGNLCLPAFVDENYRADKINAIPTTNKIAIMRTFLPKPKMFVIAVALLMANLFSVSNAVGQTTYYSRANGNWNANGTWSTVSFASATNTGTFPVAGDIVNIGGGFNVTTTANAACASIDVTGGTLTQGSGFTLAVTGNFTGSGILVGGTSARLYTVGGNWTFNGTSASSLSLTLNGTGNQTLSGVISTATANTPALIINKVSGTVTLGSNITLGATSAFTLTAGTFDASTFLLTATTPTLTAGTLRVGAASWATNYSFTPTPLVANTIEYYYITPTINGSITYGNLQFSGSGTTANPSSNLTIQGNLTNTGGGTLDFAARNVTLSGTVAANSIAGFTTTGLVTMSKTAGTATFAGNVNGGALTINGTGGTLNLGTGLNHTFTGTWTRTNGTLNGGSSTINFSLTGTVLSGTGGTFTPASGTVNYSGAAQTVGALTYNNLTLSGSGAKTFPTGTTTVNGILSIENGTNTNIFTGTLAYGGAATLQYNTSSNRIASTEWITPFIATGGVIVKNTGTITLNAAKQFGNNTNVPLNINAGATLSTSASNFGLTFHGDFINDGTLTAGSSAITIAGTVAAQSIAGFTTTGTVSMTKTTTTAATFTGNVNGGGLTIIGGSTSTLNLGTGLTHTFTGTWTRTTGILNGGSSLLKIGGSVSGTGGTFTAGTSTVEWNAAGAQTIADVTYYNLTTSGSGIKTVNAATTVNNILTIGANTTLDENTKTLTLPGGASIVINGILDFTSSTGFIQSGTSGTATLTMGSTGLIRTADDAGIGPATGASLQTQTGGAWTTTSISTNGTVEYNRNATSGQTVTDRDYNNLTITGSTQTKTWALAATRTVNGNLTINTSAPLTLSGTQTINLKGNWSNSGAFTAGTSTINMNGSLAQTMIGSTFYNLAINNTSGVTLNSAETITTNLSLTAGSTLNLGIFTHSAGTLTLGGGATASGSWGSTSSAATHKNDTYFSATTGIVNVTTATCSTPTITTTGTITPVCFNGTLQQATLVYSATTNTPTSYSIDWDGAANTAGLSDQASIAFAFAAGGGNLTTIDITGGTPAGTYNGIMTISNDGGCTNTTAVSIIINAAPVLTITNPAAVCSPATVNLTLAAVTAGSTLNGGTLSYWNDAGATTSAVPDATAVGAGIYYIKATNTCGSDIKPVTVTVNANYTITATAGTNGSISPSGVTTLTCLGTGGQTYTITPDAGYHIADVLVDAVSAGAVSSYPFSNVVTNHTIDASFAINTYALTYTAGANGSLTGTTPQTVNYGADGSAVTAVPDANYHFVNWSDASTANPRTDVNVTGDITVTANFALNTYTLTYNAGANGTISGTTPQTVNYGADGTAVTAVANTGYHFVDWSDASTANPRTDVNVTGDITVTANFAINTYTLTYTAGANGSLTGTTPQTVNYGADGLAVTAVPDANYHFVNWSDASTANPRTDVNVTGDITVTANFALNTYTLTYNAGANGTISGTTPQTVNYGADGTAVTAVANTGYHFVDWSDASTANPRTDVNVTGDITVTANFAINTYTLTYTAGANGSLTGTTPQTVNYGADGLAVTAVPDANYHFVNWSDASTANPRTDVNVTGDITVTANFALNTYTLTYNAGANGTISGTTPQTVNYGADGTAVTAVANTGYHFVDWSDASTANPRTDVNVTGDITVTANFAINTYTLTYTAGANGSLTGTTPQTVNYGADGSAVTAVPDANYHFVNWSDASTANPRTDVNVTGDITVTANFALNTYTLTYNAGANGTISGTTPQTVNQGADGTAVTAVANTGYHFVDWSDASTANPRTDVNVTGDITVTANFAINTYTLTYTAGANGSLTGTTPQTVNYGADGSAVTAVPDANYHFVNWSDASTANPRTDLAVTGDITVTANFAINTYTLTYTAGANGSLTGTTPQTVNYGADGSAVTAVPDANYHFVNWSDASTANPRTDVNVTGDITVTANFALNTYTLTYNAGANGTISGTTPQTVNYGADGTAVTAVANTGYHFVDWSDASTANPRTDVNVTGDITVTANFAINTYTLTYTAGANGSLTGTTPQTVNYGADGLAVTAVPDANYHFVNWSDASTANPRTDVNVTGDITVTANFALNTYTLTYNAGANGSLTGTTPQTVNYGADGTAVTAVANTGYHFVDWSDASTANPRTDVNVTGDITVTANFAINTYTLTYTAGANGSLTGTTPQTVNYGADGSAVTAVPDANYHFVNWSDASTANPRTDVNVMGDITVTANFALNTYTLTYNAGANGTISGTTPQTVNQGADGTAVTAVANTGYHFVDWSDASTANPRTDVNVTGDITVTANFALNTYTLTYNAGANGSLTGTTPQTVNYGADGTAVTAVANTGYHFVDWSDASTANPRTDVNVTGDITVTANFAINTYTLTYTAGANGSLTGTTPQTVNYGADGSAVTAVPDANYHFVNWSDASTANPRTDVNVTGDITVTANFALNTYTLTYNAGANGTISGTTPQTVNYGADGTAVTAVANTGYHFVDWSDASTANPRTDVNVTGDITVTANFAINTYTLTYTAGANGSLTGTTPQTVNYGADGLAVTAVPDANYHFVNWSDASTANPRTDVNVTGDITVTANFALNTYTLTYNAGANGTISGTTPQTVNYGADGTAVTAVANTGYHFVDWSDASTANPRTDVNVTGDITVTANFAINTYTLTYTAGANGSLTGTTPQTVNYGADGLAVTAVPDANYHFVNWSDASTANPRTDVNVTGDITVTANFALNTYTLTYNAGANGTISGTTPQTVNYGADGTAVTAVANTGYHFVDWSDASTANPRTDVNVTGDITVTANFAINTYTLTYTAGANGSLTGTTPQTVNYGADGSAVTAVPDANYHFVNWSDASTANPRTDVNVTGDITVTANFALNTYTLTYNAGANGTISGTTPQTVNQGADGTAVTAVANTGYHFVDWSDASTANPRTDVNVTGDITVTANFAINTYTLTYTAGANGSLTGTTPQTVNYGADGSAVTAVPDANYHFVNWSDASTANPRTDLAVTGDITVTANFAINTYTLTYTAGANGSLTGTTPQTVNYGADGTAVTAVANTGYHFVDWSDASTANPRTDVNVTGDITVTANFAINTYTLTYTAGANGSLTGTTPQTVNYGADGSAVTAVPDANYHFVNWSDASTANPRTDVNVMGDITVTANFALNTYTLTYNAGANGTISGTTPQTVNQGADGTAVTAVANTGYHFVDWSDASTANPRTDVNVTGDITVTANFAINTYTLTYTAGANGSLTGTTPQTVNYGADGTAVTAVANTGYHFVDWSDASTANPRTDVNVTGDITVIANFTIDCVPPVADDPADVTACGSYTLPTLSAGNRYYTVTGGGGTELLAGYIVTSTQTIYVYAAATPPCLPAENSFIVTINTLPACSINGATTVCPSSTANSYTAVAGMSSYAWSISGNGTINGTSNQQTVSVDAGANNNQTYTLTLTIFDGVGCSSTCSTIVSVEDNTPPVLTSNNNVTLNFDSGSGTPATYTEGGINIKAIGDGTCASPHLQLGVVAGTPPSPGLQNYLAPCVMVYKFTANNNAPFSFNSLVATQETGPATFHASPSPGFPSGVDFPVPIPGNYTFPPGFQNVTEVTWTQPAGYVTIDDLNVTTQAVASCPANIIKSNDPNTCGATVSFIAPQATDDCSSVTVVQTAGLPSGSLFPIGTTTNTFRATDAAGNFTECSFDVTVNDTQLPVIACLANIVVSNTPGTCGAIVNYSAPTVTDNCPGVTSTLVAGLVSGSEFPIGTTTNTYLVTDASGNTATCSFTVTVNDTELPVISNSGNAITVNFDAGTGNPPSYTESGFTFTSLGDGSCATPYLQMGVNNGSASPTLQNYFASCVSEYSIKASGNATFSLISVDVKAATALGTFTVYPGGATVTLGGVYGVYTFPPSFHNVTEVRWNQPAGYMTVDNMMFETGLVISCNDHIVRNVDAGTCGRTVTYNPFTVSDNCTGATLTQTTGLPSGSVFPVGTTTNTYVATDASGNSTTCSFDVTIIDNEVPVLSNCPSDIIVNTGLGNTQCSQTATWTEPTATDNCTAPGAITWTKSHLPGDVFPVGTTQVTYIAADASGNTSTVCSFNVTVVDNTAPVIECPTDIIVSSDAGLCSAVVTYTAPVGTDNCSGAITTQIAGLASGSVFPLGITTNTFSVSDALGNSTTCSFTVTVNDTEAPVISCPSDINVNNDEGLCSAVVTYTAPVGTDNCSGVTIIQIAGLASGSAFPAGVTTNTFRVTDASGNSTTCSFTVTVNDTEAPSIVCPGDITVSNDAGLCGAVVTYTAPVGTDVCSGAVTTQIAGLASGSVFPVGTTTNTFRVSDAAGNSSTCTFTVTVNDTEAPVIECPTDIIVSSDAGLCSAVVTYTAPVGTDNCSGAITTQIAGLASGSVFPLGITTNTFSVSDALGNSTTCSFTVTVNDTEAPVISCPSDINVNNDEGLCSAVVTYTAPVGTDNCSGVTIIQIAGLASGSAFPAGVTTNTFRVTDASGNSTTCSFTVTVNDTEAPSIVCPGDITVSNDAGLCGAVVTYTAPVGTDVCSGAVTTQIAGLASGSVFPVGTTTNTFRVSDAAGNSSTCTFTVTVTDTELPVITCAAPVSVSNDAGLCSAEVTLTAPTVSDNCGGTLTPTNDHASTTFPVGTTTVTWTVTDVHGNTATCTQDVTVTDTELPVITCAAPVSVSNDAGLCSAEVTLTAPTVSDNCGGTLTPTNDHASTTFPVGTTTVTWTVTDVHGNTATCTQDVTVTDTELPVITCAAPVSVSNDAGLCSAEVTLTAPTVSDNCGGTLTPTNDHASTTFPVGTTTVTWTVTDVHGNTATCTQDVTVTDTELPVITCAAPVSVSNDAGLCSAEVTLTAPTVSDNCGGTLTPTNDHASTTFPVGTTTVTWTVTDVHGNTATCTQDVTVTDTELPVITCAAPVSVSNDAGLCSAEVTLTAPTVSDNCGGTLTPTNDHASTTFPVGTTTVTWTVTDVHGNTATCTQDVTVTDTELPVITCAAPVSVSNDAGLCSAEVTLTAPTVSDNCGGTLTPTNDHASTTFPVGTTTVTWTVTDVHGNTATCTQDVTVTDTELPVITCAAPVSVSNDAGLCSAEVTLTAPTVSDNCGGTLTPTNDHASTTFPVGTTTVTWTVTDVHGNTATCTQDVTVTDTELPVITCAAPVSVSNDAGLCSAEVTLTAPTVSDNCGGTLTPTNDHASTTFPVGTTTVTWTVTDVHGNTATCTQDVTVTDTELPVITCAAPVSVSNDAGLCSAEVTLTAPTVSDNCGGTLTPTNDHASTTFPVGTTTVTWTVTDVHGNTATCTQDVTVTDTELPVITCAAPVSVSNDAGLCSAEVTLTAPTVSDNCGGTLTPTNDHASTTFPVGTTTVTWTVTDVHGNTATCTQDVTVTDTELPVITCAAPVSVSNDAGLCSAEVTLTAPTVSDNCGGTLTPTNDHASTTFPVGTTTVTWTVTDVHGNTATCTQDVTVTDTELPVITCAAPVSVSNDAGLCSAEVTLTAPTVSDNCGGTLTPTNDHASTTFPVGTTTVTWTVTDVHGNTATCTQDVTVTDTELPVITCAAPVSVSNDAGLCSAEVTLTAPTVSDNCGGTLTPTNDHASTTFPVGTTTVTWTVTDVHGNTATCTQTVTVVDNTKPDFTFCPSPVINAPVNGAGCIATIATTNPTVTDNCSSISSLTWTLTGATTGSSAGTGMNYLGTYNFNAGTTTVTYTATDAAGNTQTCIFTVSVVNNLAGLISGTATVLQNVSTTTDITFNGGLGVKPYTFTYNVSVNGGAPGPNQVVSTTGTNSAITVQQSNAFVGTYKYTLVSVTDANGCSGALQAPPANTATITVVNQVPDLSPLVYMDIPNFSSSQVGLDRDFIVVLNENNGAVTSGPITFRIYKPSAFNISFDPVSGNSNVFGGIANTNSDFTVTSFAAYYQVTTTVPIGALDYKIAGFKINRKPGIPANTTQLIQIRIDPGAGGDTNSSNNTIFLQITAN